MNLFRRRAAELTRQRETAVLDLLAHPTGWTATEIRRHIGTRRRATRVLLHRMWLDGLIRYWWADDPHRPCKLYGLPEGEVR